MSDTAHFNLIKLHSTFSNIVHYGTTTTYKMLNEREHIYSWREN